MTAKRILLISACFCGCVVFTLLRLNRHSQTELAIVDQAMAALQQADRGKLVELSQRLQNRPDVDSERELVDSGLLLVDGQFQTALEKLRTLRVDPVLANHQKLLTAVAMLQLGQHDDARQCILQVLADDPENEFAKLGMQRLQHRLEPRDGDERFVSQFKPAVDRFCGDCHASPLPESFPKHRWEKEVAQGYGFYGLFDRHDLDAPDQGLVQRYYEILAPTTLASLGSSDDTTHPPSTAFERVEEAFPDTLKPAVAHVTVCSLTDGGQEFALVSEMRSGQVLAIDPSAPDQQPKVLAQLNHPCHTTRCDLNQDGAIDFLVADLGSFYPADHRKGRVVWLKATPSGAYEPVTLLEKVGRVSDVQPGDFDGDGDLDLVVAEFGWRTSGRVLYLENTSPTADQMEFQTHVVDPRHGTIHVPVIDLDRDGNLDFIALISQEHETIVAFLGDGNGEFQATTLYSANDPSYGSSGIELTDLDQDGDQDILFTNGDTFDSDLMKPYHGVQWLENVGDLRFEHHPLINCYGAYRADAQDIDQDGDLDIVVVMALPFRVVSPEKLRRTESIVCLFNDGSQRFEKRVLERGNCFHTTCDFADVDGDGDRDLIVGRLTVYDDEIRMPRLDLWRNTSTRINLSRHTDLTR